MTVKQYAIANVDKNKLNVTTSNPATDSTNGVRLIIDDSIATSETDVMLAIKVCVQRFQEDTWPVA